ncbi:hypothetical protein MTO96_023079 [Rhipicephalus appendiculatus]
MAQNLFQMFQSTDSFPHGYKVVVLPLTIVGKTGMIGCSMRGAVNAFYMFPNTIVIPTAIVQRPFFYENGPDALNYGGLGKGIGHELMHAFDVGHVGNGDECVGPLCRYVAIELRAKLDFHVDPCSDFYQYVCGKFRGTFISLHVQDSIRFGIFTDLLSTKAPSSNQSAFQKAAAMYQACVSFASSYLPETIELVRWMKAMNLDLVNRTTLESVDPVEMMVRGSLDLGVEAIISIRFDDRRFHRRKRESYSKEQETWLMQRSNKGTSTNQNYYGMLFLMYGGGQSEDYAFANRILAYEEELRQIEKATVNWDQSTFVQISDLGQHTSPHVTGMVSPRMIDEVRHMAFRIKDAFWKALNSSSWLTSSFRTQHLPNVPANRLFPSWIQGRRLNTHYRWKDQRTRLYDEEAVNAFYAWENTIVIPAGIVHRPFFYEYGPAALDYGGLGMTIGHELMHAFDVANVGDAFWKTEEVKKEYTKRALCLRRSHRSVLSLGGQQEVLDDTVDSENLADFVDSGEDDKRCRITIFLTILIVLLLGLLCCILVLTYLVTQQSPVKDVITQVDALAPLHVPETQAPRATRPRQEPLPLARNTSATTPPEQRHLVPSSHLEGDECVGSLCRYVANKLRSELDFDVDPCYDFYKFVCGKFRGTSVALQVQESITIGTFAELISTEAPSSKQSAFQKAAAMYQACVSFASSYQAEISYSKEQKTWLMQRRDKLTRTNENYYGRLFLMYGVQRGEDLVFARKILAYEEQLVTHRMIDQVRHVAFRIKDAFLKALNTSSWLTASFRTRFMTKHQACCSVLHASFPYSMTSAIVFLG